MENDVPRQLAPPMVDAPSEGHIILALAYPRDEETIFFHFLYSEPSTEPSGIIHKAHQFEVRKTVAETFANSILEILAAPDSETAWDNIMKNLDEDCDEALEEDSSDKPDDKEH